MGSALKKLFDVKDSKLEVDTEIDGNTCCSSDEYKCPSSCCFIIIQRKLSNTKEAPVIT